MRLKDYPSKDGKRVWLRDDELEALVDEAKTTEQRIAFLLGGRCGLRRQEIIGITPNDIVKSRVGANIRVWEDIAKRAKYRETPAPERVVNYVDAVSDFRDDDEPVVDATGTTVYRWVTKAAARLQEETGDDGWSFLDVHDLRRTWGTKLLEQGVLPSVVMSFGGWDDWETFREHYLGEFSPAALERERGKVDFLGGGRDGADQEDVVPVGTIVGTNRSYADD